MTDEKERVNWSALMDAHGIDPDADTRTAAVEPDHRKVAEAEAKAPRRSRTVNAIIAVTALFSIAASVAVLVVLLRGRGNEEARAAPPPEPVGPRPAAFEQTSDGVIVVPPVPEESPPPRSDKTSAPAAEMSARKPADISGANKQAADKKAGDKKPTDKGADIKPADISGADKKPADIEPASEGADPNLPDEPDQGAVATALDGLKKDIAACATPAGISGPVGLKMRIEPDGKVAWASAKVQSSPFQACLDRLFKKARMPRSAKGATVRQTIELP